MGRFPAPPAIVALIALLTLTGCGGSGGPGGDSTPTTRASLDIFWAARSRSHAAPASALSADVTLLGGGLDGQNLAFVVNRRAGPAAYQESYTTPADCRVGPHDVRVRFFAGPDATGDVVGVAEARVTLTEDGRIPDIATVGSVATVEVPPDQTVQASELKDLAFTARTGGGAILALSPGSAFFSVTAGADRLRFVGGQAEGVRPGDAQASARVDGVASVPVTVRVTSNVSVAVAPNRVTLPVGGTHTFSATVTGTTSEKTVVWSVAEGVSGGTVTAQGVYTAPPAEGIYHVVATSTFDPTRRAVAEVTAESGGLRVAID